MRYLISYDVVEDRDRTHLAHLLEDYGQRVQYSVFECELNEHQFLDLREKMIEQIDLSTDSIRIYRLCAQCRQAMEVIGAGPMDGPESVVVI